MRKRYRLTTSRPVTDIVFFQLQKRKNLFWYVTIDQRTLPDHLAAEKVYFYAVCDALIRKYDISYRHLSMNFRHNK